MKNSFFALILSCTLFFIAIARADEVNVGIDDVLEYGTKACSCSRDIDLDRTCVAATKYSVPPSINPDEKPPTTGFEASIVNGVFHLDSAAYYLGCQFDKTPAVFTDPAKNELFKNMKYYDFYGVEGYRPLMQVATVDGSGNRKTFARMDGKFTAEKFYENKGTADENYRLHHKGEVFFQAPLSHVLSDRHIQEILDGKDHIKKFKITLMVELKNGLIKKFGEYTLKARFFKEEKSISVSVTRE